MLELIQMKKDVDHKSIGAVFANDADANRANMLIHQLARLNCSSLCVINHNGQFLPKLNLSIEEEKLDKQKFYFDKILVDVPCSGDGTFRKYPKKWLTWNTREALTIHQLQLQILQRCLQLAKVGGLVVYSTCSLNPIEDEAVVTEMFRKCGEDSLELVDIHSKLPGLVTRKGLIHWDVLEQKGMERKNKQNKKKDRRFKKNKKGQQGEDDENQKIEKIEQIEKIEKKVQKENISTNENPQLEDLFTIYKSKDDFINANQDFSNTYISGSMFPDQEEKMKQYNIQNCIRILPQDQSYFFLIVILLKDSGGFFIALFKKKPSKYWNPETYVKTKTEEHKQQSEPKPQQKQTKFEVIDDETWKELKEYYGIVDESFRQCLIQQQIGENTIRMLTPSLSDLIIKKNNKKMLKIIVMGDRTFMRNQLTYSKTACKYRITQEAINYVLPFITKRKILTSFQNFKQFITTEDIEFENIPDEELRTKVSELGPGSFAIYFEEVLPGTNNILTDSIMCSNFYNKFSPMIGKEFIEIFKIRYLDYLG